MSHEHHFDMVGVSSVRNYPYSKVIICFYHNWRYSFIWNIPITDKILILISVIIQTRCILSFNVSAIWTISELNNWPNNISLYNFIFV